MKTRIFAALAFIVIPATVLAQTATSTSAGPVGLIGDAFVAFRDGSWGVGVGLVLMLVMALGRGLGVLSWIPKKLVPWVTMGFAMVGALGAGLIAGVGWQTIAESGMTAGLAAIGGWESFGRLVRDKLAKKK